MSMRAQIPTIGRIVHYTLASYDVERINTGRAQTQTLGNPVTVGDVVPLIITATWGNEPSSAFNGQAFLDGADLLWVTSTSIGEGPGHCAWPPRV